MLSCLGEAGVARGGEGVKRTTVTKQRRRGSTLSHLQYWSPTSHFDRMLLQLNDAGNGNLQIMTDVVPKMLWVMWVQAHSTEDLIIQNKVDQPLGQAIPNGSKLKIWGLNEAVWGNKSRHQKIQPPLPVFDIWHKKRILFFILMERQSFYGWRLNGVPQKHIWGPLVIFGCKMERHTDKHPYAWLIAHLDLCIYPWLFVLIISASFQQGDGHVLPCAWLY